MKFCPRCGEHLSGEEKFCPDCGMNLSEVKDSIVMKSDIEVKGADIKDTVVTKSKVKTSGSTIKDSVIMKSTVIQIDKYIGDMEGKYENQMNLGKTALEGKNYEEAIEFFTECLKIKQDSYEPWFLKGQACLKSKRYDEATVYFEESLDREDADKVKIFNEIKESIVEIIREASILEKNGREMLRKENMEYRMSYRSSEEHPLPSRPMNVLGYLIVSTVTTALNVKNPVADRDERKKQKYIEEGKKKIDEATNMFNCAIKLCDLLLYHDEKNEFALTKKGDILYRLKLYRDACDCYEKVLRINDKNIDAWRQRTKCYHAMGIRYIPNIYHTNNESSQLPTQYSQRIYPQHQSSQQFYAHRQHFQPYISYRCRFCGQPLIFVEERKRWYCYSCRRFNDELSEHPNIR